MVSLRSSGHGACDLNVAPFHAPCKSAHLGSIVRELDTVSACCFSLKVSLSIKKDGEFHLFGATSPPPLEHRSNLSFLRAYESYQEEASSRQSNAILVTSVNSPTFQSDVISTFDMLVFL